VPGKNRRRPPSGIARAAYGWRLGVILVAALAVLAADGWWLVRTRAAARETPGVAIAETASQASSLTSAKATFTTQVVGVTTMFGRVREQLRPHRVTLTMTEVDGADRFPVSELVTDTAVYLRIPALAGPVGKPWLSVPLTELTADPAISGLYQTAAIPTLDAALVGTASTVRAAGTQLLDGVQTHRYVGLIDPVTALRKLPRPARQLLAPELAGATGELRFVVWIDGRHDLRKFQADALLRGLMVVTTVVVTAVDARVHINVPAAGLVAAGWGSGPPAG